jgi:hypothetical protein
MKKVLVCSALALLLVGFAYALDSYPLTAEIPFPFYVGDAQMPAGEYLIEAPVQHILRVMSRGELRSSASIVAFGISTNPAPETAKLVFTKYEDGNYFLSEIWAPSDTTGLHTMKSKRERESITSRLMTGNRPQTVVVMAKLAK